MLKMFITGTVATLVSTQALAMDAMAAEGWQVAKSNESGKTETIVLNGANSPSVFFTCGNGQLRVGVSVEPGDMVEMLSRPGNRTRNRKATTSVGGSEPFTSAWVFMPHMDVAIANKELTAKKLYNAAVSGKAVEWHLQRKDQMTIRFPETNDAFKSFANDCPVTNPDNQA